MMTTSHADTARSGLGHETISARAAQLWRERGEPSGQDQEIWLEAERALEAESRRSPAAEVRVDEVKPMPPGTAPVAAKANAPDAKPNVAKNTGAKKRGGGKGGR